MTASCACAVPGTDALTFSLGLSSGIFAKSGGSSVPGTYSQGPARYAPRNQRPVTSTYVFWSFRYRNTFPVVFLMYTSAVFSIGIQSGAPSVTTSSVGLVATIRSGAPAFSDGVDFEFLSLGGPVIRSTVPSLPSLAAVAVTSAGTLGATRHGPLSADASTNPSKR